jgi:hypothetical protein
MDNEVGAEGGITTGPVVGVPETLAITMARTLVEILGTTLITRVEITAGTLKRPSVCQGS